MGFTEGNNGINTDGRHDIFISRHIKSSEKPSAMIVIKENSPKGCLPKLLNAFLLLLAIGAASVIATLLFNKKPPKTQQERMYDQYKEMQERFKKLNHEK